METITKISWAALGALHVTPSLALFAPRLVERLYGVNPDGDLGILLVHRAAMFLTVTLVCALAIFDPSARRLSTLVVGISMMAFLLIYARAGLPQGPLQAVARADLLGLLPLACVTFTAWRPIH